MKRCWSLPLWSLILLPIPLARAQEERPRTVPIPWQACQLGQELVYDAHEKVVRLARSVLLTDEQGATDYHQAEKLSERTWARKLIDADRPGSADAELFF